VAAPFSIKPSRVGVLFAGGLSRRMGGIEKALMPLGGRPMIAHVIERLRPQVDGLIVNANGDPARFDAFGLPVVPDLTDDFAGPLAGLLAGMEWVRKNRPDTGQVVTAACDTPFFPADLVARLSAAAEAAGADIAMASSGGQSHFVFALWPVALAGDLAGYLGEGRRKVQDWIERHSHTVVPFSPREIGGAAVDPFFNVNTPDDLATAEARLRKESE
jgi:molybdenum cofactor guanylyltransferase